ncbi:hypothetical protein HY285_01745 [Candidatus Peregrinibacteria bacterium]|nr:hypothetical protein [Candidatus Peregrinibacteria bacterium]MBI3816250.1 hypothetical protein [Candidatus Peregrinibacteria bacterium]
METALFLSLAFVFLFFPLHAGALTVVCTGLPGCQAGIIDVVFLFTLPGIIALLTTIAAGTSIIFIIFAGIQMVFMYGDEGRTTKAKQAIVYALTGLGVTMVSQIAVSFIASQQYISGGGDAMLSIMRTAVNIMIDVFDTLLLLAIIIAGIRLAYARGKSDEFTKAVNMILWAIIGAIVVNLGPAIVSAFIHVGF